MRRRGMSILELMVVIAILLAIASVVAPAMLTWSRSSRMPEAQSQLEAALMMARADAQRQSSPVRVMARAGANGLVELVSESVSISTKPEGAGSSESESAGPQESVRVSSVYALPKGVSVSETGPDESATDAGEAGGGEALAQPTSAVMSQAANPGADPSAGADRGQGVLLAVFLPDGEALRPGPRYLVDGSGRRMELVVEPMSGRIVIRPVTRTGGRSTETRASTTSVEREESK